MPLPLPTSALQRLDALAENYGTPLQLYDEQLIRDNARRLLAAFRAHFPDFQQFFAVKALPNPAILKLLHQEGCGMDCSSSAELHIVKELGVPGDQVIFTSNFTAQQDLATAFDQGVIMNLDDVSLVDSLVAVRGKCPELMSFRLNPGLGRTDSETKSNVLGGPDAKFGVPPFQIVEAYRKAQQAGAKRFGIHMMTGSCVMNQEYWRETVTVLFNTIVQLKKELGIEFEFMNIGGGLGIPYRKDQESVNVEAIAKMLQLELLPRSETMNTFFTFATTAAALVSSVSAEACSSAQQQGAYVGMVGLLTGTALNECATKSGYNMLYATALPTDDERKSMCAVQACHDLIVSVLATNPPDCDLTIPTSNAVMNVYQLASTFETQCEAFTATTAPPTDAPTSVPTDAPTTTPTDAPTITPTDAPTSKPTDAPTKTPTTTEPAVPGGAC